MSISISSSSVGASSYVSQVSATRVRSAVDAATGEDGSDSSSVSGPAAMMNKLKALQKSDPAKLKEALTAIAKKLTEEAGSATDTKEKQMLTDVASKFTSAASTGDLSKLQPPAPPDSAKGGGEHHGKPPGGGGGVKGTSSSSSSSSSSAQSAGAADTNSDGKITEAEQAAYDEKQALAGDSTSSTSSVDAQKTKHAAHQYRKIQGDGADAMKTAFSDISSVVDKYAA